MEKILNDISAISGVVGSFVCDEEGRLLASALPDIYDQEMLARAGRTAAQTAVGLWMAGQRKIGDIDLVFSDGRLIVKSLESAYLCILGTPRLNLPLLNLTANVAVMKLQKAISEARSRPAAPPKLDRLKAAARDALGDHAKKVLDMLSSAKGETPAELQAACDEAVRFTSFFMSQDKAVELGQKLQAIVEE